MATGEGSYSPDASLTAFQDILQANPKIDVVLSNADQHLLGVEIALKDAGMQAGQIDEVILGQILAAGHGQNPARQASINAGVRGVVTDRREQRLEALSEREQLSTQLAARRELVVCAWRCEPCATVTEKFPAMCKAAGHAIARLAKVGRHRRGRRAAGERAPTAGAHRAKAILQGPRKNQTAC